ncbi:MAG: ATP-dependent DNA ligase [Candidatus Levybacteria bacterium]|nr:ATP-dependent DNA ligase [Candidatus Levybacteria bacterium]
MTFSQLAVYFEKLEATSSRLSLIEILSDLFKHSHKDEIEKIVYLLQGRVAPFFSPVEIGMADKMVAESIAQAFGISKEEVIKENNKKGDLGLVAFELAKHKRHKGKQEELSVSSVFESIKSIAGTGGVGSVEKKITALKELLEHMDEVSSKHLVRIPLGNTRLGIGDPTVLDGLATAKLGDKTNRKLLEKAYNETSDLGLIAKTLWSGGLDAVKKLTVTVGRPIRSELCERLPNPTKVFEKMATPHPEPSPTRGEGYMVGVHCTPKYDGFRVQIHKNGDHVTMFSRNLENMTHMFPEIIEGTLRQVKAKTVILDSEALAYQPESEEFLPFQETTKRRRKHNIEEMAKQLPLKTFVFDILYCDGKSLLDTPLIQRTEILKKAISGDEILIPAPGQILDKPEQLQILLDDSISKGLEGVVVKRLDSKYEAGGRNFNWVKLKRHSAGELQDTVDCVILGYIYGRGKRTEFGAGSLLVGLYDKEKDEFVTVTKIGTGLSDDEWREIHKRADKIKVDHKPARVNAIIEPSVWIKPEIVIEVLADEITRSPIHTAGMEIKPKVEKVDRQLGYALRFPRLVRFREADKRPEDATSVSELVKMYREQGRKV